MITSTNNLQIFIASRFSRHRVSKWIVALLVIVFIQPILPLSPLSIASAATVGAGRCITTVSSTTGVTVTDYTLTTGYCQLQFVSSGTITMTVPSQISEVTVLVVGGGAGGGVGGGEGGGGGAIIYGTASTAGIGTFAITAGAGGAGGSNSVGNYSGKPGNQSSVVANNGAINLRAGGGGGGASRFTTCSIGTQSTSSTTGGLVESTTGLNVVTASSGAKGGLIATSGANPNNGIAGTVIALGGNLTYGSGGGGGSYTTNTASIGGTGGGTGGAQYYSGGSATSSLGGGGGGGGGYTSQCYTGGSGASGVVYVNYKLAIMDATGACKIEVFSSLDVTSSAYFEIRKVENDCVAIFKGVGVYNFIRGEQFAYQYLIVGGGGGGGANFAGGGGGGGGFLSGNTTSSATSLAITVGAGGLDNTSGSNSLALGLTAYGGGSGGYYSNGTARSGGSGGGAGASSQVRSGGSGTTGQGFAGGTTQGFYYPNYAGGGGGGASALGESTLASATSSGGNGGAGLPSSILGSTYYFAGGGGGGLYRSYGTSGVAGNGGIGGGGGGSQIGGVVAGFGGTSALNPGGNASSASGGLAGSGGANTGGGAGGNANTFGANTGGSGIVVLRWASQQVTIEFSANDATSGTPPSSLSFWAGSLSALIPGNSGNLTKTDKHFGGWNTRADASGTNYFANDSVTGLSISATLYATFRHRVSYNLDGGSGTIPSASVAITGSVTLPTMLGSTKNGNPFLGWCDPANPDVDCFGAGRSFTPTSDITLYALYASAVSIGHIDTRTVVARTWGYSESFTATGGFGTKTFTVSSSAAGFSLAPSATPSQSAIKVSPLVIAETYTVRITATDALGNRGYETTTVRVINSGQLVPVTPYLQATFGTAQIFNIPTTGGVGTLTPTMTVTGPIDTSTITLGSPAVVNGNLILNVSSLAAIGRYQITIQIRDDSTFMNQNSFTLDVKPVNSLSYQPTPGVISQNNLGANWQILPTNTYLATGTYLNDAAGKSNATIRGPSAIPTPLLFSAQDPLYNVGDPSYLQLNTNGYIASNQPLIFDTSTSYSIFTWVRPQSGGSLITLCATSKCDTSARTSIMEISSTGILSMRNPKGVASETETSITLNEWHYIGYTIDSATATMSAYLDGRYLGDETIANGAGSTRSYIALGASAVDSMTATNGGLGQFSFGALHFYKSVLDSQTVVNNFDSTKYAYIRIPNQSIALSATQGFARDFGPFKTSLGSGVKTFTLSGNNAGKISLIAVDSATVTLRALASLTALDSVTAATYYETITVTDRSALTTTLQVELRVYPPMSIQTAFDTFTVFSGTPATLGIALSGGNGNKSFSLVNSPTTSAISLNLDDATNPRIYIDGTSASGIYVSTVTATDQSGASVSDSSTITIASGLRLNVSPSTNINLSPTDSITVTFTAVGGIGPYVLTRSSYTGQSDKPITFNASTRTMRIETGLASGSTTLETIIATDSLGDTATVTISIRIVVGPTITGPDVIEFTEGNTGSNPSIFAISNNSGGTLSYTPSTTQGLSTVFFKIPDPQYTGYPKYETSGTTCYTSGLANIAYYTGTAANTSLLAGCNSQISGYATGYFIAPITGTIKFGSDIPATYGYMSIELQNVRCNVTNGFVCPYNLIAGKIYPIKVWLRSAYTLYGTSFNLNYQWDTQNGFWYNLSTVPATAFASSILQLNPLNSNNTLSVEARSVGSLALDSVTALSLWETITVTNSLGQSATKRVNVKVNPPIIFPASIDTFTATAGQAKSETLTALYGTGAKKFTLSGLVKSPDNFTPGTGLRLYVRNDCSGRCDVKSAPITYLGVTSTLGNIDLPDAYNYRGSSYRATIYGEGYYKAPVSGSVTFYSLQDDTIIFDLGSGASVQSGYAYCCSNTTPYSITTISNLVAGTLYPFKIWLGNATGGAKFVLYHGWTNQGGSSQVQTVIPITSFYPPEPTAYTTQNITITDIDDNRATLNIGPGIQSGDYLVTVTATDRGGSQASKIYAITATPNATNNPKWSGDREYSLVNGNTFVSDTFTVLGGTAPYVFQLIPTSGFSISYRAETPTGLMRVTSNTPLATGSYSFAVKVTDGNLRTDSMTVVVNVVSGNTASTQIARVTYGNKYTGSFNLPVQTVPSSRVGVYPRSAALVVDTSTVSSSTVRFASQNNLPVGTYNFAAEYRTSPIESDTIKSLPGGRGISNGADSLGIVADAFGNFYIADYVQNRIVKFSPANDTTTVFAGSGGTGVSDFTKSRLEIAIPAPFALALDKSGNLLVLTKGTTYQLMRINSDNSVTLIAGLSGRTDSGDGGLAASANLGSFSGLAVDSKDNIYVVGINNIRVISKKTGIIASLTMPSSITVSYLGQPAIDSADTIFIPNVNRMNILKYSIPNNVWSIAAGSPNGYSGDAIGDAVTSALFNQPKAVAIDTFGDIWISDFGNQSLKVIGRDDNIVRRVALTGVLPFALAISPQGDVLYSNYITSSTILNTHYGYLDRKVANNIVQLIIEEAPAGISMDLATGIDLTTLQYGKEYPVVLDIEPSLGSLSLKQQVGSTLYNSLNCNNVRIVERKTPCQWVPITAGNVVLKAEFIPTISGTPATSGNFKSGSMQKEFTVYPADSLTVTFNSVTHQIGNLFPDLFSVRGIAAQDSITAVTVRYIGGVQTGFYNSTTAPSYPGTYSMQIDSISATPIVFGTNSQGASSYLSNYKGVISNIGQLIISKGIRPSAPTYPTLIVSKTETYTPTISAFLSQFSRAYSSPSASVCSINSVTGVIATISVGTCDITMTITNTDWADYFDNSSVSFSIFVTKASRTLTVSGLTASTLKYGQSATANITISQAPNDGIITYTLPSTPGCSVISLSNFRMSITATKFGAVCTVIVNISEGTNYIAASSALITVTITKADAPVLTLSPVLSVQYSGVASPAPTLIYVQGLVNGDQVTSYTLSYTGASSLGTNLPSTAIAPFKGGSYQIAANTIYLTDNVLMSVNYNVAYPSASYQIFRVEQPIFTILTDVAFSGASTALTYSNVSPTSQLQYAVVAGGTATGCSAGGASVAATSVGTCLVTVTRLADDNYFAMTSPTKTITFQTLAQPIVTQQTTPSAQQPTKIGVQGGTGLEIVTTACASACLPTITSISSGSLAALSLLTITGTNFNTATEVIFNRKFRSTTLRINSDTEIVVQIPSEVPVGAANLAVVASGGTSFRFSQLTIIP